MKSRRALCCLIGAAMFSAVAVRAEEALRVTSSAPTGELQRREQAAEIRVVFSEPMAALGRVPELVAAPFFAGAPWLEPPTGLAPRAICALSGMPAKPECPRVESEWLAEGGAGEELHWPLRPGRHTVEVRDERGQRAAAAILVK